MINTNYMYKNNYTEEFLQFSSKDYSRKEKLEIKCVDHGLVLPLKVSPTGIPLLGIGGVLDENDEYVPESAQIGKGDTAVRFWGKYEFDTDTVELRDESVIYIGALPLHWGHFLIDMVYRFWIFADDRYADCPIVYCSENAEFSGVHLQFLSLLGIDEKRLIRISRPTRFAKVYIPEQGYMACEYYAQEYRGVFEQLAANVNCEHLVPYEKIYLSRGHFKGAKGKEIGEKRIEENFAANGFHVLYMEELSLAEQVFYISNCKVIAAINGTLCHNLLFANTDKTLIILNKTHFINTHQVLINQMIGCQVIYVDVYIELFKKFPISYGDGPFWISADKLSLFFKDNNMNYLPEKLKDKVLNYFMYIKMCVQIKTPMLYVAAYKEACKHNWIIKPLRLAKKIYDSVLNSRR